jgi:hypothetical protein
MALRIVWKCRTLLIINIGIFVSLCHMLNLVLAIASFHKLQRVQGLVLGYEDIIHIDFIGK